MRARAVAVLIAAAIAAGAVVGPAAAWAGTTAAAGCGQNCTGATPMPWGWSVDAQQTQTIPAQQGAPPTQAGQAEAGQEQAGAGSSAQAPANQGGAAASYPCTYTSAGPGLEAQWCPGYTTLGTTAGKLIPVAPAVAAQPVPPAQAAVPARPRVTPLQLAIRALQNLAVPLPQLSTAPPRGSDGAVGMPEWFWLSSAQWTARTSRATAGPVWATVTARPQTLVIDPGDGTGSFTCPGPGAPYNPGAQAGAQHSDCIHLYQEPSVGQPGLAYPVTVTVTWIATWQGSGGTGGTLPPLNRAATFPLRIAEGQALIPAGEGS